MSDVSIPDYPAARKGSLTGTIDQAMQVAMTELEVMLPATIISYDRATNRAIVQPQIMMVSVTNQLASRATLASVPVLALGGGGYVVNFPLPAGSKGWIKASDRDISLYLQSGVESAPNTRRLHSFSDGLFVPDVGSGFTIAGEDTNNAVIQNLSGSVRITLWSDQVKITAPTVLIDGNLNVTGEITAGSGGSDSVTLQQHKHGTGTPEASGTSIPTPGT